MMFLYPAFLWALMAISIPVIIHLFNFRRYKKVYFTNVKFLKELQHESKSKSRLKEILILIARCLAIACLVLAFSQPIILDKSTSSLDKGAKAISIYIDNSFSMENVQKQGPLLNVAKLNAKEIVKAYGANDKFQIITNDFEGKHQRFCSKEDVLSQIDEIKASSAVKKISDVYKRQSEFLKSAELNNKKIYFLSDAQKSTFNIDEIVSDTSVNTTLIPLSANEVNNVYIDSCWFETPIQQKGFIQKLHALVVNKGSNAISAGTAKLYLNKQQLALSSYSMEAYSEKEIQFSFECKQSGFNYGSIKLEDYPITFDDELYFAFNSQINIAVSLINGKDVGDSNAFETLFNNDSIFNLFSFGEQAVDYSKFKSSEVIVLNQLNNISSGLISELNKFTNQGGCILIIPSEKADLNSYNTLLNTWALPTFSGIDTSAIKTDKIVQEGKFYSGVFEKLQDRVNLPLVNKHYKLIKENRSNFEEILVLQNGDPYLGVNKVSNSAVYLITAALNQSCSNFSKHALFVPTVYRICFNSIKSTQLFYEVNSNTILYLKNETNSGEKPEFIKEINNQLSFIPEIHIADNSLMLHTRSQITSPGFYEVMKENLSLMPLAFNYSRLESDLSCYAMQELLKIVADKGLKNFEVVESSQQEITKQLIEEAQGKKLWKLFIILALTFVFIEILLLRFLK